MTADPLPALRANNYGKHSTATIEPRIISGLADDERVTYWYGQITDLIRDRAKFGDPGGLHRLGRVAS